MQYKHPEMVVQVRKQRPCWHRFDVTEMFPLDLVNKVGNIWDYVAEQIVRTWVEPGQSQIIIFSISCNHILFIKINIKFKSYNK